MENKAPQAPSPGKKQDNGKAYLLGLATFALLGIIGYELIWEGGKEDSPPYATLVIPPADSQNIALQRELNQLTEKLNEMKRLLFVRKNAPESIQVKELNDVIELQNKSLEQLKQNLRQLEDELTLKNISIDEAKSSLKFSYARHADLADEVAMERMIHHVDKQSEKKALQDTYYDEKKALQDTYNELKGEFEKVNGELAALHSELEQERKKSSDLSEGSAALSAKVAKMDAFASRIEDHHQSLEEAEKERDRLKLELDERINEHMQALAEAEKRIEELKDALDDEFIKSIASEAEITYLKEIKVEEAFEINRLKREIEDFRASQELLSQELQALDAEFFAHRGKSGSELEQAKAESNARFAEISRLQDELRALIEQNEISDNEFSNLKREHNTLSMHASSLHTLLAEKEAFLSLAQTTHEAGLSLLQSEGEGLKNTLSEMEQKSSELQNELMVALDNYEGVSEELQKLRAQLQEKNEQLSRTQAELEEAMQSHQVAKTHSDALEHELGEQKASYESALETLKRHADEQLECLTKEKQDLQEKHEQDLTLLQEIRSGEASHLQKQIAEKDKNYEEKRAKAQADYANLKTTLEESDREKAALHHELTTSLQNFEAALHDIQNLKELLASKEGELEGQHALHTAALTAAHENRHQLEEGLSEQLQDANKKNEWLAQHIQSLESTLTESLQLSSSLEQELATLENAMHAQKSGHEEAIEALRAHLEGDIQALTKELSEQHALHTAALTAAHESRHQLEVGLSDQLQDANKQNERFAEQIQSLEAALSEKLQQSESLELKLANLEKAMHEQKSGHAEAFEALRAHLEGDIQALTKELSEQHALHTAALTAAHENRHQLEEGLSEKLQDANKQNERFAEQIHSLEAALSEKLQQSESLELKLANLEKAMHAQKSDHAEAFEALRAHLEGDIQALTKELQEQHALHTAALTAAHENRHQLEVGLSDQLQEANKKNEWLAQHMQSLESTLTESLQLSSSLEQELATLEKAMHEQKSGHEEAIEALRAHLEGDIQALTKELSEQHALHTATQAELSEASDNRRELEDALSSQSTQTKALQEQIEDLIKAKKEEEEKVSQLKSSIKDVEEAFESLQKTHDSLEAKILEKSEELQDVSREKESLNEHIHSLTTTLADKLHQSETLEKELESLEQKHSEALQKAEKLLEEIDAKDQEVHASNQSSERTVANLKDELAKLQAAYEDEKQRSDELKAELAELRSEMETVEEGE